MRLLVRILMWTHYVYLLLLPTLAVVAARMMFPAEDFHEYLLILGFPPVLMFTLFLANGYTLPDSFPVALTVALAIPAQLALSVLIFGDGSIWLFFAESAAVEINSFLVGTLSSAFIIRRNELGGFGFFALLGLVLLLFFGGFAAYLSLVFYGYGGFSPWLLLFATSFAVALWEYAKVYKKIAMVSRKTGSPERVTLTFDGGFLAKILGIKRDVPMVSPFRNRAGEMSKAILIFGFTAMFLPVIVAMIMELTS